MRLVLDTNVLISALLAGTSLPAHLLVLWREGRFELLLCQAQLEELRRVTRYPRIRERLSPALAGRLINELRDAAVLVPHLPAVDASPDPDDNYLLAMSQAGGADFLVTGDKADVLALRAFGRTRILTTRAFLTLHGRLP